MKPNPARAKLKRGETTYGTWLVLPSPTAAQLMAGVGFDWLTIEMEHTPVNIETAALSFAVVAAHGAAPLARIPWNTGENIKRALDTGAWGVVVPMVNSRAEAEAVVAAARYPPLGRRSIGGQLHASNFGTDAATYYARANEEILIVVMLETIQAVEAADDILSVPGLDVAFIGPNDLLNSMGRKPAFDSTDREFVEAVHHVRETAQGHGVAPGIHVLDPATAQRRAAEGFRFIALGSEAGMMLGKAAEIARALDLGPGHSAVKY